MTPEALALIHGASFTRPRPWSASEFADLLADPKNFLIARSDGFILGRTVLDEAELLTLAVAPTARRHGTGRTLLAAFEAEAQARGAISAFLEVASDNQPARGLYDGAGWQQAGCRRNYYAPGIDGLVLRKDLSAG